MFRKALLKNLIKKQMATIIVEVSQKWRAPQASQAPCDSQPARRSGFSEIWSNFQIVEWFGAPFTRWLLKSSWRCSRGVRRRRHLIRCFSMLGQWVQVSAIEYHRTNTIERVPSTGLARPNQPKATITGNSNATSNSIAPTDAKVSGKKLKRRSGKWPWF